MTRRACLVSSLLVLVSLLGVPSATAQVRLPLLFSDHMVLQRDVQVPVWGWAAPGSAVRVTFQGRTYDATAAADSAWKVTLPATAAGGPYTLAVRAGSARVDLSDVYVGDVWVCSGQSNMEWVLANARNGAAEVAAANDPMIRHFKVPLSWANAPEETLAGGTWQVADPQHAGAFTAVGYFFARDLREHVDVPIGLLHTSWGGSRIEPWMSPEMLGYSAAQVDSVLEAEASFAQRIRDRIRERLGADAPLEDVGFEGTPPRWAAPDFDDADWGTLRVPGAWEEQGFAEIDGIGWYRLAIDLTAEEARQGATLGLGPVDETDWTYVNGQLVGRTMGAWSVPRTYQVPASALRAGRNVIVVRAQDTSGGGGIVGSPDDMYLEINGTRRSLAGAWSFRLGQVRLGGQDRQNQIPTLLYNKMIHPLLPFPIKGVLWYQGESNAGGTDASSDAYRYRTIFANLITGWRKAWGMGDFPFLYVQLANYMAPQAEPKESGWALLRESQTEALRLPNTGQAVIIDIGEAGDIHPRNKQDVGARLALAARKIAYGQDVVYSGPVYTSYAAQDGRIAVTFNQVGGGLVTRGGGAPKGFAIAGDDKRFVWAEARIEGDRVIVWSDQVPNPVAVRYAWADNPDTANLYNAEGLPASPFRTDRW